MEQASEPLTRSWLPKRSGWITEDENTIRVPLSHPLIRENLHSFGGQKVTQSS